jgi:hypothetical protein
MNSETADERAARQLAGSCYCGAVRYEVADEFEYALNCHCSNCRRTTGSAFKPFGGIARHKLRVTAGADRLHLLGDADGHNANCSECGSLLYSLVREGKYVHVAYGTLVDSPTLAPRAHIFVASKAPWFTITDDLPQFSEFPD